jgi:hypothetical protein
MKRTVPTVIAMNALLTTIVTWLSIHFALPAIHEHPRIELVPPAKMAALRYRGLASDRVPLPATVEHASDAPLDAAKNIVALYDREKKIIYLPEGWTGRTPAELSVLVHEMVHHLQNLGGERYECPAAMEKPAYKAQAKWLEQFDRTLEGEFELDGLTLLVRTNCLD